VARQDPALKRVERLDEQITMRRWMLVACVLPMAFFMGCADEPPADPGSNAVSPIDLGGLAGSYSLGGRPPSSTPSSRTMIFSMPDNVAEMNGLRLDITGSWNSGQRETCRVVGGHTACDTLPAGTNLTLRLRPMADTLCVFRASIPVWSSGWGSDMVTGTCDIDPPTFGTLLNGAVMAELSCDSPPEVVESFVTPTYGTITSVRLVLLGVVPADGKSGGGNPAANGH
jgi:hypothetical protein